MFISRPRRGAPWFRPAQSWLSPGEAPHPQDQGPFAYAGMTRLWHRVRLLGGVALLVSGLVFLFVVGVVQGLLLIVAAVLVVLDVGYRVRHPEKSVFFSFLLEGALIASIGPVLHVEWVAYLLGFLYLSTAALYFLPTRRAFAVHGILVVLFGASAQLGNLVEIPMGTTTQRTVATATATSLWVAFVLGLAFVATRTVAEFHRREDEAKLHQAAIAACSEALQLGIDGPSITTGLVPVAEALACEWGSLEPWQEDDSTQLVSAGFGDIPGEHRVDVWRGSARIRQRVEAGFSGISIDQVSELVAPIQLHGATVGAVAFGVNRIREWTLPEQRLVERVAGLIGVALERENARRRLEHLVAAKDEFVASVSHELRTPLTAVVGLAQELRDGLVVFDQNERSELVALIADQGAEVAAIVEDLLVAARIDAGTVTISPQSIDLGATLRSAVAADAAIGQATSLALSDEQVIAWADPHRVRQVVRNLLTNATRYGGPEVKVEFGLDGSLSWIEVSDNGDPIDPADRGRIFEAYERAHIAGTQPASVGLGLSVSRNLARLMGGDLTYDYIAGRSVFRLTLPVEPALV